MSTNTNKRVTLYAKYNKIFPYKSRNKETEIEQTISVQPLSTKRNIAKLHKLYHHQTINELYNSILSNNNYSYNNNNNNNTITNDRVRHIKVPKIKLYKSVINKNCVSNNGHKAQMSMSEGNEHKQLFCLVNGSKYKKKITTLYKHKRNFNLYINNTSNSNNNQRTYNRSERYRHTFTNQTLSSLCKIDMSLFKLNSKIKNEVKDELHINNIKRNTVANNHNTISKHNEPVIKQFIKVLNCSKKQYQNKTIRNYVNDMNKEIKREIRKNELFVKETMDSLKRLQRNNDEILNKVCFLSA